MLQLDANTSVAAKQLCDTYIHLNADISKKTGVAQNVSEQQFRLFHNAFLPCTESVHWLCFQ